MATILELASRGVLTKYDALLRPREFEDRRFYGAARLVDWFANDLPNLESSWKIEETPSEQLYALLLKFVVGKVLTYQNEFYPIVPHRHGVWELKTADLRVFGWFPAVDCFLGLVADTTQRVKDHDLYHGYCNEVVRFRETLELDEPKFIEGREPKDVVSNFAYSDT